MLREVMDRRGDMIGMRPNRRVGSSILEGGIRSITRTMLLPRSTRTGLLPLRPPVRIRTRHRLNPNLPSLLLRPRRPRAGVAIVEAELNRGSRRPTRPRSERPPWPLSTPSGGTHLRSLVPFVRKSARTTTRVSRNGGPSLSEAPTPPANKIP